MVICPDIIFSTFKNEEKKKHIYFHSRKEITNTVQIRVRSIALALNRTEKILPVLYYIIFVSFIYNLLFPFV